MGDEYSYTKWLYATQTDSMLKRLLIFGLGTSLIQVIMFYSVIFIVYWFAAAIAISYPEKKDNPYEDYVMLFAVIIFPILVIIQNVVAAILNNKTASYVLVAIAMAAYIAGVIDTALSVSFKLWICLFFGLVALGIKPKIDERITKWFLE